MKQKKIYDEASNLINLREEDDANLDKAEAILVKLVKKDSECDWAYGLLAQIYYWRGEVAEADERADIYEKGVEYGEKGMKVNPDSLESNFWLAVNYGLQ